MTQADVATRAGIYPTLKDMNDMHLVTALIDTVLTLFRNRDFRMVWPS